MVRLEKGCLLRLRCGWLLGWCDFLTVVYMSEEIETLLGVWAVSLSVSSDMYGARRRRRFFDAHAFLQRAGCVEDVLVPLALVSLIKTRTKFIFAATFFRVS